MSKKTHQYSSSKKLVAGTLGALSVFALTTQANNVVQAKGKQGSSSTGEPASMSSSANALRSSNKLSLAPITSSSDASTSTSEAHDGVYVVKSGDTLSELAVHFNVTVDQLVNWNHIQNPDLIYVGQTLSVNGQNVSSATQESSTVAQPQSFDNQSQQVTGNQVQQQAFSANAQAVAAPQTVTYQQSAVSQPVASTASQSPSVTGTTAYTNAAYYAAASDQASSTAQGVTPPQSTATNSNSGSNVQTVSYNTATTATSVASAQAASNTQAMTQSQQVASSTTPAQVQQSTTNQTSQATSSVNQATATQSNNNLQSGSVVGLASKIASSNSVPYQWGGNSLSGMDCSGFVQYVYANAEGKQLPHNTVAMESYVNQKPTNQAQAGDLLFWGNHGSTYHVGIYMGNNQYAAAAKPGTNVAVYNVSQYFYPSFAGTVK